MPQTQTWGTSTISGHTVNPSYSTVMSTSSFHPHQSASLTLPTTASSAKHATQTTSHQETSGNCARRRKLCSKESQNTSQRSPPHATPRTVDSTTSLILSGLTSNSTTRSRWPQSPQPATAPEQTPCSHNPASWNLCLNTIQPFCRVLLRIRLGSASKWQVQLRNTGTKRQKCCGSHGIPKTNVSQESSVTLCPYFTSAHSMQPQAVSNSMVSWQTSAHSASRRSSAYHFLNRQC